MTPSSIPNSYNNSIKGDIGTIIPLCKIVSLGIQCLVTLIVTLTPLTGKSKKKKFHIFSH